MAHAIPANMTMEVEVFKGKKIEQVYKDIQQKYGGNYKLLEQKKNRKFLWMSDYEVKILVENKLKEENVYKKEPAPVRKDDDAEAEAILAMLKEGSVEPKMEPKKESDEKMKEIESMKNMMEELVQRVAKKEEEEGFLTGEEDAILLELHNKLVEKEDVEEEIARKIILEIKTKLNTDELKKREVVEKELIEKMSAMLNVSGPFDATKTKTIALVGPTGVGKTTTLAKIAAILKQNNKRIGLISTDVYRIGAIEQLQTYANIMDSKMIEAKNPQELKEGIDYFRHVERVDLILIDTVGRSPMKMDSIEGIKEYLEISNPDHTALVLSSTQKYKDMLQILKNFENVDIDSMIFTKLDETMSYGFILNILSKSGMSVSYVTNGQNVPKDIYAPTAENLAKQILNGDDEIGSSIITA